MLKIENKEYDKKTLNIKIPEPLHQRLKILATFHKLSLKEMTALAIEKYLDGHEQEFYKKIK